MKVTVYSLPDCPKCEKLKKYLKRRNIPYESLWFDTDSQTEFVMMNVFGNPPILTIGDKEVVRTSEELFQGEELIEEKVEELLRFG
ncbi:MAG TPA: glutaredoxin family protein [Candidatus Bathyarchaeota archaeon]|nr:glutaredoxin family protein [Candidatus Bathyarchaeota archaeon]